MRFEIRVVSLIGDESRRDNIIAQLQTFHISTYVTSAVNGKLISAYDYFSMFQSETSKLFGRKYLTPSELGCFLSHKKAIGEFLQSESEWLIVLEDDVSIRNVELFESVIKGGKELNINAIYILGGQDGLKSFKRVIMSPTKGHFRKVLFGTHRWIYRTCCYMVNKVVAKRMYDVMLNTRYISDDWPYIMSKCGVNDVYYSDCFSHPLQLTNSNIEAERVFLNK